MAATAEGLRSAFEARNFSVNDDDVLEKCVEACRVLGRSAEKLVDLWDLHAMRTSEPEVTRAAIETLMSDEKRKMKSRSAKGGGAMRRQGRGFSSIVTPESARVLSQAPTSALSEAYGVEMDIDAVPTHQPKRNLMGSETAKPGVKTEAPAAQAPRGAVDLSATPFILRKDAGMVVHTFNGVRPAVATREQALSRASPEDACPPRCEMEVVGVGVGMPRGRRYMREDLARRAQALSERLQVLSQAISQRAGYTDLTPLCEARQDDVRVAGRVCCDAEGALNEKSVLLEGDIETAYGRRVRLDVRMAEAFSLFPGQVVVCEGLNPRGDRVVARRILQHAPLPLPCTPAHAIQRFHHDPACQGGLPLNIWVAQGPYTATDNLAYQPLDALLAEVASCDSPPDVLLLVGPFVDETHPQVQEGELGKMGGFDLSADELFQLHVEKKVSDALDKSVPTRVAIVPSTRDVMARPQYPQPPLDLRYYTGSRVVTLSNPATFRVNEVVVGVNAEDVVRHTMQNEALRAPSGGVVPQDRVQRLARNLIGQQSFYPLYPAPEGSFFDVQELEHTAMPCTPDVLVLCSQIRYFASAVDNVLCVNPGRVTQGTSGGTYAKLAVHPAPTSFFQTRSSGDEVPHEVAARTRVEIVKV